MALLAMDLRLLGVPSMTCSFGWKRAALHRGRTQTSRRPHCAHWAWNAEANVAHPHSLAAIGATDLLWPSWSQRAVCLMSALHAALRQQNAHEIVLRQVE